MQPPAGTRVWLINTSIGFIDKCRYKTQAALCLQRKYFWKTEHGARTAFENIETRFPSLGPTYELWEGIIVSMHGWGYAQPVQMIDTKTV